jgi:hypothetical protein
VDGFESVLVANECPYTIGAQLHAVNKAHMFAYKRHDAKIAWPKMFQGTRAV